MISYIKGILMDIEEDSIIIDHHGLGYEIRVPTSLSFQLPSLGEEVIIYTYLYVREDAMLLYGFSTKDDLEVFKKLLTVNGIGPKGALGILSTVTTNELRIAIASNDEKTIAKAPGVGKKTAQRLIIDLKDKLKIEDMNSLSHDQMGSKLSTDDATDLVNEAISALVALDYSQVEATQAVKGILDYTTVEDLIKKALKQLAIL